MTKNRARLLWPSRVALTTLLMAATVAVPATPASASRDCGYLDFTRINNTNSDLKLKTYEFGGACVTSTWRAGSGTTTDPCQKNYGWLPTGWYDLWGHWNGYSGDAIWGRVWYVQNKECGDGTQRTELFIHSEETPDREQSCTSDSDDPQCWDKTASCASCLAGTNDYYSNGCIKVKRTSSEGSWDGHLDPLHDAWHNSVSSDHGAFTRGSSLHVHN